jgi:Skp family chaperone for outer membrane proteins
MRVAVQRSAKGLAVLALLFFAPMVTAQEAMPAQSSVLTIDSERMFADSLFGQRVTQDFEAQSKQLEAENREIEAELIAEEQELTDKRATLSTEEFRALADAFDQKVELIRLQQSSKSRALTQALDTGRREFLSAVQPILARIMTETNAAIIVEQRSVFLSRLSIDITNLAIERLDAEIGAGNQPNPEPNPEPDPAPSPEASPQSTEDAQ